MRLIIRLWIDSFRDLPERHGTISKTETEEFSLNLQSDLIAFALWQELWPPCSGLMQNLAVTSTWMVRFL